jgi:two-component system response regulator YesN
MRAIAAAQTTRRYDVSIPILLVDDEAIDLEWLRRRVVGSGLGLDVAGTASSGFAALEIMRKQTVDIILSDIRMPIMTGTEFARKAREINPAVKIVFISGHEDFSYAKEAIEVHAHKYLLKPVADDDLYLTLKELCDVISMERQQKLANTETLTLASAELVVRWAESGEELPADSPVVAMLEQLVRNGAAASVIELDDLEWKLRGLSDEKRGDVLRDAFHDIHHFIQSLSAGKLFYLKDNRLLLLSAAAQREKLLENILEQIRTKTAFTATIGAGNPVNGIADLRKSYWEAKAALQAKWILGKNRLIPYTPHQTGGLRSADNLEELLDKLLEEIMAYDLVAIDDSLLKLFNEPVPCSGKQEVYDLIIRVTSGLHARLQKQNENLYEVLKWESQQPEMLFHFETVHDIMSWIRRRFFELSELLYMKRQRQKRKLIQELMEYVEQNLDKKITLKEAASHFGFTPNYLGFVFKEDTGEAFSDYLTRVKLERVCELLKDPTLKIYEIADRMGYINIIYFNRQFKQAMGLTPGEYRKKHKI